MPVSTYALVLVSTFTHAYWNFILKRSGGGSIFVGLSKVVEVVVFAPVFVWFVAAHQPPGRSAVLFVVVGAALVLVNYAALDTAYRRAELSLVYPVSRAGALLFLPLLGYLALGERVSALGLIAVAIIIAGIVVLQLTSLSRKALAAFGPQLMHRGVVFALVAAMAAAAYTVWDKRAVQTLAPFFYFYAYTAVVAAAYMAFLFRRNSAQRIAAEWRTHRWSIVQVGVFNTVSYLLVLFALRDGTSSYVIAVRQLSIVWGVLLGNKLLGENLGTPRRVGIAALTVGCTLIALSR